MSSEEKQALVGRLVMERAQARQNAALILGDINSFGILCGNISGSLGVRDPSFTRALEKATEIIKRGGMEKLRQLLIDYAELQVRIDDITKTLKDSGAE